MATIEQIYNGIYAPYDPSIPPIPPQVPALGPVPTPPAPPSAPTGSGYDVYRGIYGPANLSSPPGEPVTMQMLTDMFGTAPASSPRNVQIVEAAPLTPNSTDRDKGPQERLLPNPMGTYFGDNIGQPPMTRTVQSVPFVQQNNIPPLPRPRPQQAATGLGNMFAMPTPVAQRPASVAPLRVVVNGANSYSGGGGGSSSGGGGSSAPSFSGTSSGKSYTPGQQYSMGGDTYTANAGGGFTNDRTGRSQGTGTRYYDADSNTFRTR